MRHHQSLLLLLACPLLMGLAGCAADATKPSSETPSPPIIAQTEEGKDRPLSGQIQERAVPLVSPSQGIMTPQLGPPRTIAPGVPAAPIEITPGVMRSPPAFGPLPGEFAIRTGRQTYLTARDGGHHPSDAIITAATTVGPNERFKLAAVQPHFTTIQTARGYFVSAIGGLGGPPNTTQDIQTELTTPQRDIALFTFLKGSEPPQYLRIYGDYYIQTFDSHFLTALGNGGKATDAFHTDAREPRSWEGFHLIKCGDLGSGYDYTIHGSLGSDTTSLGFDKIFVAQDGGGRVKDALPFHNLTRFSSDSTRDFNWARLKLIRQMTGPMPFRLPMKEISSRPFRAEGLHITRPTGTA